MRSHNVFTSSRSVFGSLVCLALAFAPGCAANADEDQDSTVATDDDAISRLPPSRPAPQPQATSAVQAPPVNGQFDYQIGGAYAPVSAVAIVDRDSSEPAVSGKYNICYINAFQAQPDATAWWKANHDDLLLKTAAGKYVVDSGWNENVLDTTTAAKRTALAAIVNGWIDDCKAKGYQAIEPDNLDSWDRSKNLITKANNIAFATLLAQHAHSIGLAIAQKNASEIANEGKTQVGFDFAIAEECQRYTGEFGAKECDDYMHYYGNNLIEIEYNDNGGTSSYNSACTARGAAISITYRDRDVLPKGSSGYIYQGC
jgi:Glycoside-hydrolase family GH114